MTAENAAAEQARAGEGPASMRPRPMTAENFTLQQWIPPTGPTLQ